MRKPLALIARALSFAAPFLVAATASAAPDPSSCGNIQVSAQAQCEVTVSGGCEAQCTPIACEGQCTATATVDCSGSCEASCNASCDPGSFDCEGSCNVDCSANCDGHCAASGNQASCKASCEATCSSECSASCTSSPPECSGGCQASCEGSCTAEANASCQIDCQGGCQVACTSPDGALFCDGRYVDTGNNMQECLDYLASLGIEVSGSASANCADGRCSAEAEATASCSASPYGNAPLGEGFLALAAGSVALAVARRRRAA